MEGRVLGSARGPVWQPPGPGSKRLGVSQALSSQESLRSHCCFQKGRRRMTSGFSAPACSLGPGVLGTGTTVLGRTHLLPPAQERLGEEEDIGGFGDIGQRVPQGSGLSLSPSFSRPGSLSPAAAELRHHCESGDANSTPLLIPPPLPGWPGPLWVSCLPQ